MMCLSRGEQRVVVGVAEPVRVLGGGLQFHQVDDVDHADLQLGQVLAEDRDGAQDLQGRGVSAAGHDDVGLGALVVAGPVPDADPLGAVHGGGFHGQPLGHGAFPGDDDVDVVAAAQAVVEDRQQAVRVGRQVDADDAGFLVDDVVEEAGVLVGEAVVVLLPDVGGEQVVQRGDVPPPGQLRGDLQPFGVLVEHGVDDVDERLVAVEQAVPPGQQVALQPAFGLVLAEHGVQHPPVGSEELVVGRRLRRPTGGW